MAARLTRGGGGEMKTLRGAAKILRHPKGGSEKIKGGPENLCTSKPTGEGAPKKLNR